MHKQANVLAPGTRILARDAEWLVRRVDHTSTGEQALSVVGLSELVRDKEAIFLTEVEKTIEVLDPVDTKLVPDTSSTYQASLLYMESLLRQTSPTDANLYIGHQAAMDLVPYEGVGSGSSDPVVQKETEVHERPLLYVAATRAKKEVVVTSFGKASRFLSHLNTMV